MGVFLNLDPAVGGGPPDDNPHKYDQKAQDESPQPGQEQEGQNEGQELQGREEKVTKSQVKASAVEPEVVKGAPIITPPPPPDLHESPVRQEIPVPKESSVSQESSAPQESSIPRAFTEGYSSTREARQTLFGYDDQTPHHPYEAAHNHSTGPLWVVLILLVAAFVATLSYGYYSLRGENISIAQLPGLLHSVDALGQRMDSAEGKLQSLTVDWGQMSAHLAALDHKVNATLQTAVRNTRELDTRLHNEMSQRNQAVDSRLSQIEQNQNVDHASLARLNDKLESEITALQAQLNNAREENARSMVNVNNQVGQERTNLSDLNQKLQRQKVTFEASANTPAQIAPGVSLTVLKTNMGRQRFRGYVSMENGHRKLWLDNLGVQESLELFPNDASHPYSLVITQINPHGVAGYLLMPAGV